MFLLVVVGQSNVYSQRLITTWTETPPRCVYSVDRSHIIITEQGRIQDGVTILDRPNDTFWIFDDNATSGSVLGKIVSIAPQSDVLYVVDGPQESTVLTSFSLSSQRAIRRDTVGNLKLVGALKEGIALMLSQMHNGETRIYYKDGPNATIETICSVPFLVFTDGVSERFYSIESGGRVTAMSAATCDTVFSFVAPGAISLLTLRLISIDRIRGLTYIALEDGSLLCYDENRSTLERILEVSTRIVAIDVDERSGRVAVTTPDSVIVQQNKQTFKSLSMDSNYIFDTFQDAIFDFNTDRLLVANSLYSEWIDLSGTLPSMIASLVATPFSVIRHHDQALVLGSDSRAFSINVNTLSLAKSRSLSAIDFTFNNNCEEIARFRDSLLFFYDLALNNSDTIAVSNHDRAECLAFTCDKTTVLLYDSDTVCIHSLQFDSCLASIDCSQLGTIRTGEIDEAHQRVVITGTDGGLIVDNSTSTTETYFNSALKTKLIDRGRRSLPNHCNSVSDMVVTINAPGSLAITQRPYSVVNTAILPDQSSWIVGAFHAQDGGTLYVADNRSRNWCVDLSDYTMSVVDSTSTRGTLTTLDRRTTSGINTVSFAQRCIADFRSDCEVSSAPELIAQTAGTSGLAFEVVGRTLTAHDLLDRVIRSVEVFDYSGQLIALSTTTTPNVVFLERVEPARLLFIRVTGDGWHELSHLQSTID